MGAIKKHSSTLLTVEEYFLLEEKSDIRHEYLDGNIYAMAGGTLNHNELVLNFATLLREAFRKKGCRVFAESVNLEAVKHFYYPYPDVLLTCTAEDIKAKHIVAAPSLIVEVLSESTEEKDRSFKLITYQKIPSVIYYVLVSQYSYQVEVYSRVPNSDDWLYRLYENPESSITFSQLNFKLSLANLYDGIIFEPKANPEFES